jgi:hypothetical protein
MANVVYPKFKEAQLAAASGINVATGDLRAILVDLNDYAYSAAHDFLDDVPAIARVSVSPTLIGVTTTSGLIDAADTTWPDVTGDLAEGIIIYLHTGNEATSRLVAFLDTVTGLPVQPNGGDINLAWNASGVVQT